MTDQNINKTVNILEYACRSGIFAIFSEYDRENKTGVLRYISNDESHAPRRLRKKYKNICTINTLPVNESVEYDIDE